MSPAGLTSGALGPVGALEPPAGDDDPPQPAAPSTAAAISAPVTWCFMGRTVATVGQRPVRARSTPGQKPTANASPAGTVGCVSAAGILLVEDDEAIASGLMRVLD